MRQNQIVKRQGFTLIELLVVITVIVLMMSLLIGASFRFVVGSKESATAATIIKVNGIVQDRARAFQEADFSDGAIRSANAYNVSQPADQIMTPALAEVFIRKARFRKAFPQCFAELDSSQVARFFPTITAVPPSSTTVPPWPAYDSKYECGIVLYAFLLKGETFGAATPGDDTFTAAEVKISPETGGLPCLVDAWGQPLRFYRWPTRLIQSETSASAPTPASLLVSNLPSSVAPAGSNNAPLQTDPDDPTFKLSSWFFDPNVTAAIQSIRQTRFLAGSAPMNFLDAYHDFGWYHTPLVVSSGPDRQLGLYEPTDIPNADPYAGNFGYLAAPQPASSSQPLLDNVTNLNQRPGGK